MACWNPANLVGSKGSHGPAPGCPLTVHLIGLEAVLGGGLGPHGFLIPGDRSLTSLT